MGSATAAGFEEGGGIQKTTKACGDIAPERRSEVAQSVFVAWWAALWAGISLRVGAVIDRFAAP